MKQPIVILAMPRSGSSMTAGIFARHGVWVGRCRAPQKINPLGFYENLDIKAILIRRCGRLAQTGEPAEPQSGLMHEIRSLKDAPEGIWCVKHSAMYRKAWEAEFEPMYVCVKRSHEGIIESNRKTGFLGTQNEAEMRRLIGAHELQMAISGGASIYPDEIVRGDYRSLREAFYCCGLRLDDEKVKGFVRPDHWHH